MTAAGFDALYRVTFGPGILLGQGGLAIRSGRVCGIGHYQGEYSGTASVAPATAGAAGSVVTLDFDVQIQPAFAFATGVKAGPAGSTLRIKTQGPLPASDAVFPIELAGVRGELHLSRFATLNVLAPALDGAAEPNPTDAFPDGFYRLSSAGVGYLTHTVVVLNGGQLLGLGELGGQYRGNYIYDPIRRMTKFTGEARLPPGAPLIIGGAVGSDWLTAQLTSEAKFQNGKSRFSFALAGRAIDAELTFARSLPQ